MTTEDPRIGPGDIPAPDGHVWTWVPSREIPADLAWEVVPLGESKRCRHVRDGSRCAEQSVARLNRSPRADVPDRWWHYCGAHLYGRRVLDGRVESRILTPDGPLFEVGLR